MTKKDLLIIFSKNPETQKVKTRLAKAIGQEKSTKIYEKLLKDTILENQGKEYKLKIYCLGGDKYYDKFNVDTKEQHGVDLGEKMLNAFCSELTIYENVIIIGSDMPNMDNKIISSAFKKLEDNNVVIGPSDDGGYYLIGMNKPINIFTDIVWGKSKVYKNTLEHLKGENISYADLPKKRDLDTKSDLDFYNKMGKLNEYC